MNFERLMTYFRMKNMLQNEQRISSAPESLSGAMHEVYSVVIRSNKYSFEYANVMFRKKNGVLALVYADIMNSGFSSSKDTVEKINATVGDLKNTFIGYDYDA